MLMCIRPAPSSWPYYILRCPGSRGLGGSRLRMRHHQRLAVTHPKRAQALRSDAWRGHLRSLQHQVELVGEQLGLRQTGSLTQCDQPRAPGDLVLLDDSARRVILLRQLDRGIGKRAPARVGRVVSHTPDEGPQLLQSVARMGLLEACPTAVSLPGGPSKVFCY